MNIYILTNRYPYGVSEEAFLGNEIYALAVLSKVYGFKVIVVPYVYEVSIRPLPQNVEIIDLLARLNKSKTTLFINAICCLPFWREMLQLIIRRKLKIEILTATISFFGLSRITRKCIKKIVTEPEQAILYSYWFDHAAHAIASLKLNVFKKLSRAHGYDLYKERRPHNHMPMNKTFHSKLDVIVPISRQGEKYLNQEYGVPFQRMHMHYLGTKDYASKPFFSPDEINFISVSVLESNKRVDGIFSLIKSYKKHSELRVNWHHFGGKAANEFMRKLGDSGGVKIKFYGECSNEEIIQEIAKLPSRIFINNSLSEGLPVSIMEAMMLHTPVIAPNVGGIAEMVDNYNGFLFNLDISDAEFQAATNKIIKNYALHCYASREKWDRLFNNYKNTEKLLKDTLLIKI